MRSTIMTFSARSFSLAAQLGGQGGIGLRIGTPRAGALDRSRAHDAVLHLEEALRARARERHVTRSEQAAVMRGRPRPQPGEGGHGIDADA